MNIIIFCFFFFLHKKGQQVSDLHVPKYYEASSAINHRKLMEMEGGAEDKKHDFFIANKKLNRLPSNFAHY